MKGGIAIVRQHLSKIAGVSRTWFEWDSDGEELFKTLVVEVISTDPNSPEFRGNVLDAIRDTAKGVLAEETTMVVSHLKIVPKNVVE